MRKQHARVREPARITLTPGVQPFDRISLEQQKLYGDYPGHRRTHLIKLQAEQPRYLGATSARNGRRPCLRHDGA
jgi:hypothetical protein